MKKNLVRILVLLMTMSSTGLPFAASIALAASPPTANILVSRASDGKPGREGADGYLITSDGRFVIFTSCSPGYVPNVGSFNCNTPFIFRKDVSTGEYRVVSSATSGSLLNGLAIPSGVSDDGNIVIFQDGSVTTPGVPQGGQIFAKNIASGVLSVVTTNANGDLANRGASFSHLSGDGRYATFTSSASNLSTVVQGEPVQVFRKDLQTGEVQVASLSFDGQPSNSESQESAISQDGRYVVFTSQASNLVLGSPQGFGAYRRDFWTGLTERLFGPESLGSYTGLFNPVIDGSGSKVIIDTQVVNPNALDTSTRDVFLWDVGAHTAKILNRALDGSVIHNPSYTYNVRSLSRNGRYATISVQGNGNYLFSGKSDGAGIAYILNLETGQYNLMGKDLDDGLGVPPAQFTYCDSHPIGVTDDGATGFFESVCVNMVEGAPSSFGGQIYSTKFADEYAAHIVGTPSKSANEYGWYNSDVNISWTIQDPRGEFAGLALPASTIASFNRAHSDAISATMCNSVALCLEGHFLLSEDLDPPLITSPISLFPRGNGNYVFTVDSRDQGGFQDVSGIAYGEFYFGIDPGVGNASSARNQGGGNLTALITQQPTDANPMFVRARDRAGNWSGVARYPADNQAPVVTGTPDRQPNTLGWYNGDVAINWSSVDPAPSSGTPTRPPVVVAALEGANTYDSNPSCDPAGNCAIGKLSLSIDKTPPNVGLFGPLSQNYGSTRMFTAPATDAISGVTVGEYFVGSFDPGQGGGAPMTYSGGVLSSSNGALASLAPGVYQLNMRAKDVADNWSPISTTQLTVALPAPTGLAAASPTNNAPVLTWNAVTPASSYQVWRQDSLTGISIQLGINNLITSNSFTDSSAQPGVYSYNVIAVSNGVQSIPSNTAQVALTNLASANANSRNIEATNTNNKIAHVVPTAGDILPGLIAGNAVEGTFDFRLGYPGGTFNIWRPLTFTFNAGGHNLFIKSIAIDWLVVNSPSNTTGVFQGTARATLDNNVTSGLPFTVTSMKGQSTSSPKASFKLVVYADSSRTAVLYQVDDQLSNGSVNIF